MTYVFNVPCKDNKKLRSIVASVNKDVQLQTFWKCANVMAIDRLGYTDHGPTPVKIVANIGLRLLRILVGKGIVPNVVKDYNLSGEDAEVIVVLASIFHDLGMIIGRERHEEYSLLLAFNTLERYLRPIYTEEKSAIIVSEVLQAMLAHDPQQKALTLEEGIVRIADSLDMEQGRARIPFEAGKIDIHSVSALSIEKVECHLNNQKQN